MRLRRPNKNLIEQKIENEKFKFKEKINFRIVPDF